MKRFALALALVLASANFAEASPIHVLGNTCPVNMTGLTRQYQVIPSVACVYDVTSNNIQGTTAEALAYLESGPDIFRENWIGLGQNPTGFSFTADAGNDDGTFTIGAPLTGLFGQFAIGIKDGAIPFWSIHVLPTGTFSGDWHFLTGGGDLSHFALYGRVATNPPGDDPPGDDPPNGVVPEPSTLLLLGTGLALFARKMRAKRV